MSTGQGANLNGFRPFTSSNLWNTDISSAPVDSNSSAIIDFIGANVGIHPDFGSGLEQLTISRPTARLRRSCVWRNQACAKVHVAEQQGRDDSSGITWGRELQQLSRCADGHAPATQVQL